MQEIISAPFGLNQWDLNAGNTAAIIAAKFQLYGGNMYSLQLAPNSKIYGTNSTSNLCVINNPNISGIGCGFNLNGVSCSPNLPTAGLPNFISSYFDKPTTFSYTSQAQINTIGCQNNGSATVTATAVFGLLPYTYTWSNNFIDGPTTNLSSSISNLPPGNYTVIITDATCMKDTVYFTITGLAAIASSQNISICKGSNFVLPGGNIVNTPGTYIDTLIATNGCDSIITTNLSFYQLPNISANVQINSGNSTTLTATGGGSYLWYPAVGLDNSTNNIVVATPAATITYCVIVSNNGCIDTLCVTVFVETPCPNSENLKLPNAFSPNNDGMNDEFCLQGWGNCIQDFSIIIFDRWGEKVFESKDQSFCWDGKFKGTIMDSQVYVYYLLASFQNIKKIEKRTGNISLIR